MQAQAEEGARKLREEATKPVDVQQKFRDQKPSAAVVAARDHVPGIPESGAVEADMLRNGERQLAQLKSGGWPLRGVDLLTSTDIYTTNALIRSGEDLEQRSPALLGCHGFNNAQEFVDAVDEAFALIGEDGIVLDKSLVVYRGVGLIGHPTSFGPGDFWGLRAYLHEGAPEPSGIVQDTGFSFASPSAQNAMTHAGTFNWVTHETVPVFLELHIKRGLCIPDTKLRSTELTNMLKHSTFLPTAQAQIIFPRDSEWEVTSAAWGSGSQPARLVLHQV